MGNGFRKLNKQGLKVFFTAAFFGLVLIIISFFLDTEALFNRMIGENIGGGANLGLGGGSTSNATVQADQVMSSLKCPMVITTKDQANIQASVSNPTEKEVIRIFEMYLSRGYTREKIKEVMPMDPGKTETLRWEISPDNATYGFLILARGFLHPYSSLPSQGGTCGILFLDIPYATGSQLLWGAIGLSFIGMLVGAIVFIRNNQPLTAKRWKWVKSLLIVAGVVMAGLLLIFLEFWYVTFFITLVTILLVPAVFLDLFVNN